MSRVGGPSVCAPSMLSFMDADWIAKEAPKRTSGAEGAACVPPRVKVRKCEDGRAFTVPLHSDLNRNKRMGSSDCGQASKIRKTPGGGKRRLVQFVLDDENDPDADKCAGNMADILRHLDSIRVNPMDSVDAILSERAEHVTALEKELATRLKNMEKKLSTRQADFARVNSQLMKCKSTHSRAMREWALGRSNLLNQANELERELERTESERERLATLVSQLEDRSRMDTLRSEQEQARIEGENRYLQARIRQLEDDLARERQQSHRNSRGEPQRQHAEVEAPGVLDSALQEAIREVTNHKLEGRQGAGQKLLKQLRAALHPDRAPTPALKQLFTDVSQGIPEINEL